MNQLANALSTKGYTVTDTEPNPDKSHLLVEHLEQLGISFSGIEHLHTNHYVIHSPQPITEELRTEGFTLYNYRTFSQSAWVTIIY